MCKYANVWEEYGRVTSRAYDRYKARMTVLIKERTKSKNISPRDAAERDVQARRRYAEASRRLYAGEPELSFAALFSEEIFP